MSEIDILNLIIIVCLIMAFEIWSLLTSTQIRLRNELQELHQKLKEIEND